MAPLPERDDLDRARLEQAEKQPAHRHDSDGWTAQAQKTRLGQSGTQSRTASPTEGE